MTSSGRTKTALQRGRPHEDKAIHGALEQALDEAEREDLDVCLFPIEIAQGGEVVLALPGSVKARVLGAVPRRQTAMPVESEVSQFTSWEVGQTRIGGTRSTVA